MTLMMPIIIDMLKSYGLSLPPLGYNYPLISTHNHSNQCFQAAFLNINNKC